ncbi:MAG: hypothetical protein ACYC65_05555 [Candidatus Limnocylindrales bacterium]
MTRTVFRGKLVLMADLVLDGDAFDTLAERIEGVWLGGRRTAA